MGVICNKPMNLDTFREQKTLKVRNKNCDWGEERREKYGRVEHTMFT